MYGEEYLKWLEEQQEKPERAERSQQPQFRPGLDWCPHLTTAELDAMS
jgi:hypothetical protein